MSSFISIKQSNKLIQKNVVSDDEVSVLTEASFFTTDTFFTNEDIPERTEREVIHYDEDTSANIEDDKEEFNAQYRRNIRTGKSKIFPNHKCVALRVVNSFKIRSNVVQMVIGYTQSGKTGAMVEVIQMFVNSVPIPIENIYIITGLSSRDWKRQSKERFPSCLHDRIYHNSDIRTKLKKDIQGKKNVLILIDEVQLAALKDQTICQVFKELNWCLDFLMENDIKMVQFSATPDGLLFALKSKWPTHNYSVHRMTAGEGYYGAADMLARGKIKQNFDICGYNSRGEVIADPAEIQGNIKTILHDILTFSEPKYNIFRTRGNNLPQIKENIINTIIDTLSPEDMHKFDISNIHEYTQDGDVEDINKLLFTKPKKHTFILLKEKLKCAQTLEYLQQVENNRFVSHNVKHNIGVMFERWTKSYEDDNCNDSFIIQGLLGRLCGYGGPHNAICYTNENSIIKYEELFESSFSEEVLKSTEWNSNSTRKVKGGTVELKTFNSIIPEEQSTVSVETVNPDYRVPVVCQVTPEFITELVPKNSQARRRMCINEINRQQAGDEEFRSFIRLNKCFQTTNPTTNKSYKIHVTDVLPAIENNRPLCLMGIKAKDKDGSSQWQINIDNRENRILMLWQYNVV